MSSSEAKAPPPAELSLKYMAWDVKEIGKKLDVMNESLRMIANALVKMSYKGNAANVSCQKDDIPF